MKTAMQELIDLIENGEIRLDLIENHKQIWLEKEKEQIIKAMNYSTYREWKAINVSNEQYYNETYNQNES